MKFKGSRWCAIDWEQRKPAFLRLKSGAGVTKTPCYVIGETLLFYEIEVDAAVSLGLRMPEPGGAVLVPKRIVEFRRV